MRTLKSISGIVLGFTLAAALFMNVPSAQSEDEHRAKEAAEESAHLEFVNRVRRALGPATPGQAYRLVVVASEHGIYTETFGGLEPEMGLILGAKLRALGNLAAAEGEVLLELEEREREHDEEHDEDDHEEDDHDEHDEHEDDDDEGE